MIKKIFLLRLIGILAVIIPVVFWQGIASFGYAIMMIGSLGIFFAVLAILIIIIYLNCAVSLIRGKTSGEKLFIILLALSFYTTTFVIPIVRGGPYRKVQEIEKKGNIAKLEKVLTRLVKTRKNDPGIDVYCRDLGVIHYGLGKYDMALKDLSENNIYEGDVLKATVYVKLNNLSGAIDSCNKSIKAFPGWAEKYYFLRGNVYFHFKEHDNAILDYSKAIEITKDQCENNRSHLGRASSYAKLNKSDLASADYEYVIKSNFDDDDSDDECCSYLYGYFYRANFYFYLGKNEEAKEDLQHILVESKSGTFVTAEANILMGYIMNSEGQNDLAKSYYEKARKITDHWPTYGNYWDPTRIHRTLIRKTFKKLIELSGSGDEEITNSIGTFKSPADEVKNIIYRDGEILRAIPLLFEYFETDRLI
ncbi:MAG: tetratricopeptide repeat protein [Candidatus Omnitrophica bacterium]|nr:tetratricopeptide repeat protein [Candidatus Omnitrophota bacterium]